ncbi:MAG: hypothetical protein WCK90_06475 [archaeon]
MDNKAQDVTFESSMVPPTPEKTTPTVYSCSPSSNEMERMMSQILNLNSESVYHEPTCLICSNPHREELEQKWGENQRAEEVKALFQTRSSIQISKDIVENHMRYHFDKGGKGLQQLEYINKIKRLSDSNLTTLDRIRFCLASVTERLMGINSITPTNDVSAIEVEQIKSAETARQMTIFNNALKLQATIMGEMKETGEVIAIPKDEFVRICRKALVEAKTDGERKCISSFLSDLGELSKKVQ